MSIISKQFELIEMSNKKYVFKHFLNIGNVPDARMFTGRPDTVGQHNGVGMELVKVKLKISSYIPRRICRIAQSTLHFTPCYSCSLEHHIDHCL